MAVFVGIDNGISGGIVLLRSDEVIIAKRSMPTMAKKKGNEVDIVELHNWFSAAIGNEPFRVVLEEPGGSKNYGAAVSMADSASAIKTWVRLNRWRYELITPRMWQKVMLPNCPPGHTKEYAKSAVVRLWPNEDWREGQRCKKPHEGIVDAALIAEFARRSGI